MPPPSRGSRKAGAFLPSAKTGLDTSDSRATEGFFEDGGRALAAAFFAGFAACARLALPGAVLEVFLEVFWEVFLAILLDGFPGAAFDVLPEAFPDVVLDVFLRVFLDIRLPFVAFGGSINGVLRVLSS